MFVLDTKNLHERETWNIDTDDERGGTTTLVSALCYFMSFLPSSFFCVVQFAVWLLITYRHLLVLSSY